MVENVITLPLRLGLAATRFGLRVAGEVVVHGAEALSGLFGSHDGAAPAPAAAPPAAAPADGESPPPFAVNPPVKSPFPEPDLPDRPAPAPDYDEPPEPEPRHVSREAELVEEFAEPGAEDGAGASVHIEEPWKGYASMGANAVVDRLAAADPAELAAVTLYEQAHRRRKSVLAAADRRLRRANASAV